MNAAAIADRYDFAATLIADAGAVSLGYFRDQSSLEIASKGPIQRLTDPRLLL